MPWADGLKDDYSGIRQWAVGPELYSCLMEKATELTTKYKGVVHKDTGELAASARPVVDKFHGGQLTAWTGHVIADAPARSDPTRSYAAPHEFGYLKRFDNHTGEHTGMTAANGQSVKVMPGYHEMSFILSGFGSQYNEGGKWTPWEAWRT